MGKSERADDAGTFPFFFRLNSRETYLCQRHLQAVTFLYSECVRTHALTADRQVFVRQKDWVTSSLQEPFFRIESTTDFACKRNFGVSLVSILTFRLGLVERTEKGFAMNRPKIINVFFNFSKNTNHRLLSMPDNEQAHIRVRVLFIQRTCAIVYTVEIELVLRHCSLLLNCGLVILLLEPTTIGAK